jgi:uncharacterized protein DUF6941
LRNVILAFALLTSLLAGTQAAAQDQTTLQAASDQGTFMVEIKWTQNDLGRVNSFDIRFIEPETREEIEDITYDFSIYMGDHREILRRDQIATRQEFTFEKAGSYVISIDDIEGLDEEVSIPIRVTPEFPLGTIMTVAMAFGAVAIIARRNSNNLFSQ